MTLSPLPLSLWVSSWAGLFALVGGIGISWILVKSRFRFKWALEGLTLLALVLPPTVLGYYLLLFFGRQGIGLLLERIGLRVVFSWQGAVIAATVAAIPLVVQMVRTSLAEVSAEIEDAGRVDGCSRWQLFWYIDLGIAWRGIVAGGLLGFLRGPGRKAGRFIIRSDPAHCDREPGACAVWPRRQTSLANAGIVGSIAIQVGLW